MYTQEEILKMLQSGQDADAIAQQFVDALNGAVSAQSALEKEKGAIQERKLAGAAAVLDTVLNYVDEFYPQFGFGEMRDQVSPELIVDAFDNAAKELEEVLPALDFIKSLKEEAEKIEKETENISTDSVPKGHIQLRGEQDAIEAFLTQCGLK